VRAAIVRSCADVAIAVAFRFLRVSGIRFDSNRFELCVLFAFTLFCLAVFETLSCGFRWGGLIAMPHERCERRGGLKITEGNQNVLAV